LRLCIKIVLKLHPT